MTIDQFATTTKRLSFATPDEDYAYMMGWQVGLYGPDERNCHYSLFSRPELTKAWERGKVDGDRQKARERGGKE